MVGALPLLALLGCLSVNDKDGDGRVHVAGQDDTGAPDSGASDSGSQDDDTGDPVVSRPCSTVANLELVPLDPWGADLSGASLTLDHDPSFVADADAGPGVVLMRLGDAAAHLSVRWEAEDHEPISFSVDYDGGGATLDALSLSEPSDGWLARSVDTRSLEGESCPVITVYAGLDHSWFAASGRAPSRNDFEFLQDGQEFWQAVADDLSDTRERVSWSTWWWMSDFELERSDWTATTSVRESDTIMARFDALSGVDKRVLINRFWDENSDWSEYLNTDTELRSVATATGDGFDVILQGNDTDVPITGEYSGQPAPWSFAERAGDNGRYAGRDFAADRVARDLTAQLASWHQKFMVLDGQVAFITGMNTKSPDWDTSAHEVFEPLRMDFDATEDERWEVADGEALPDGQPRKDYGARIEGPAAHDVEEIFWTRWESAMDEGALYADRATAFSLDAPAAEPAAGVPLQVVATMPEPWAEQSIRETHAKAFSHAQDYIFIEDQYFRAPLIVDEIVAAMEANPDLVLIVVTQPIATSDGGAKYTYLSDETFRSLFPDRYGLFQLYAADLYVDKGWLWDTVDLELWDFSTHSKLRLIDDRYLSVGSCNMNNRGYLFEGELDVSVLDGKTASAARSQVFRNLVGPDWSGLLSDEPRNNLAVFEMAAQSNAEVVSWWSTWGGELDGDEAEDTWAEYRPSGFLYPLEIDPDYDWDVGPDVF